MAPDVPALKTDTIDLVTVSYLEEGPLLKLQARSLALYGDRALIGNIFIIVNECRLAKFKRYLNKEILPEYGRLAYKVKLINYSELFSEPIKAKHLGWKSQQALKLLAARCVCSDAYMILDTKNHFVRPLTADRIIAPSGQLKMHLGEINNSFKDHFTRACAFFGLDETPAFDQALPTATPFLMYKDIVLNLLDEMERREQKSFQKIFMTGRPFNEFYLYYAYILAHYGSAQSVYDICLVSVGTLYSKAGNNLAKTQDVLKRVENKNHVYMMGVHREVLYSAQADILCEVQQLWIKFGLIKNAQEFDALTSMVKRMHKPPNRARLYFSALLERVK